MESHKETKQIIDLTKSEIDSLIDEFICVKKGFNCSFIVHLQLFINKKIEIFRQLNNFQIGNNYIYQCECWCPKKYEDDILQLLSRTKEQNMICGQFQPIQIRQNYKIPTYFQTNEFTEVFQEIVNTYGIPRYKEINPALFTIITFPFLFGVMYGDIGHGSILLTIGLYIHKSNNPLVNQYSKYKWIILLMAFFSIYTGFIYNDFLCISLNMFGSCYDPSNVDDINQINRTEGCNYPFGLDPVWAYSHNDIAFTNSIKMKMSVIIGFIQMTFGIILKGINSLISTSYLDFIFEFIPQFIFMVNIFGYMCYLIFMKWSTEYSDTSQAYSIITLLINNPLSYLMGTNPNSLSQIERHQLSLLLVAILMVPIMLIVKPVWLIMSHKKQYQQPNDNVLIDNEHHSQQQSLQQHHPSHSSGDIFVHQIIETIEFVLGSISNTASYLRLWALSLAHNQLSNVFFTNCLFKPIQDGNFITIMIGYSQFAFVTFGVIVCMDTMECFLHSLRLHWVEFQNKFYKADGVLFQPFSIMKLNQQPPN